MFLNTLTLVFMVSASFNNAGRFAAGINKCSDLIEESAFAYEVLSENQSSSLLDNNLEVTRQKVSLTNSDYISANMVNYNISTKTTTYEYFDSNSYPKRNSTLSKNVSFLSKNIKDVNSSKNEIGYSAQSLMGPLQSVTIHGTDDRNLVSNPQSWPYRATVKIETTYFNIWSNADSKYHDRSFISTGFLEGPNLLVTAGHCVFGDVTKEYTASNGKINSDFEDNIENPRFPDIVKIYAGVNGYSEISSSYKYYAEAFIINIQKEYYENPTQDYDWAAIQLDRDLGNIIGYYDKISNWYEVNHSVYSYGYPGDKPSTMWEVCGNLNGKTTYTYHYDLDTAGGQSGSPIFMVDNNGQTYVCGIHTFGNSSYSGGTIINSFIYHYLNSFIKYHNYEHKVGTIAPTDYGFADSYPTSDYLRYNFVSHNTSSGLHFETRRYRTGFINNEYVVMSPFRKNIMEAFIEYRFDVPVSKIEVDLAHWRELYKEWTYSSECDAVVRCKILGINVTLFNLLSDSTNLPTDRTHPTTYVISFPIPVYSFEFYMHSKVQHFNDYNRGRVCIGNMNVYTKEGC